MSRYRPRYLHLDERETCARCCKSIRPDETTGESGLYSPSRSFTLCEPCFFAEDAEIEEKGTNNMPDVIASYVENLRAD